MTTTTTTTTDLPRLGVARRGGTAPGGPRRPVVSMVLRLVGAVYCLLPVSWVFIAASKTRAELFTTSTMAPGSGLLRNLSDLSDYRDGLFWHWLGNSVLYAGGGAALSTIVSALAGYALAKYRFRGRATIFNMLLAGILVPAVVLTVPQYLLLSKLGLADTYWSVLLPNVLSPYGIYLARIYASASIPDSLIEAARIDGAGHLRTLRSVALPLMWPGLVTVFLFQFVAIWNNFMLPFIMLSSDTKFPVTVGLYVLLKTGASQPALYTLAITGAMLSIIPLIALFLGLQRFWRTDLASGAVKS
jgi:multiple sugar transport system permease protein